MEHNIQLNRVYMCPFVWFLKYVLTTNTSDHWPFGLSIDWLFLVFNPTFSYISAISWQPVLVSQTMGKWRVNFITCGCDSRTIDLSYQWPFGPMTIRTNEPSDQWPFVLINLPTNALESSLCGCSYLYTLSHSNSI